MLNNQRVIALKDVCSSVHPYFCRKPVELSYVLDSLGQFSDNIYIIREHIDAVQHFWQVFPYFFPFRKKQPGTSFTLQPSDSSPCFTWQESTLEPGQFHKPTGRFDAAKRFKGASRWGRSGSVLKKKSSQFHPINQFITSIGLKKAIELRQNAYMLQDVTSQQAFLYR